MKKALAGLGYVTLTAGGDFHPALRTSAARNGRPERNMTKGRGIGKHLPHRESACPHDGGTGQRQIPRGPSPFDADWQQGSALATSPFPDRGNRCSKRISRNSLTMRLGFATPPQPRKVNDCGGLVHLPWANGSAARIRFRFVLKLIIMPAKSCGRAAHWLWTDSWVGCADSANHIT
jgi:hypothetical protein